MRTSRLAIFSFARMTSKLSIAHIRIPYRTRDDTFDLTDLKSLEPLKQFKEWFEDAVKSGLVYEANAMALATSTRSGIPSVRYVLLKELDDRGFTFFTNYESRKAIELESNPNASLLFYWEPLHRQVRVEGTVTRLPEEESAEYFSKRPRQSQLAAMASPQSQVIPSQQSFVDSVKELENLYPEGETVPKPKNWGGYVLYPHTIEFWQGQSTRMHDRIRFRRITPEEQASIDPKVTHLGEDGWVYERLAP
ncbi:Pyridoxine-5'-phosphate oxidase [Clonorchis sinensis]|uniref:pyridoxal 5'-phosphate synthase n=2 Tax=Clonorchis sinensis TaxID=79923 RepID=A0A8T1MYX2_CLOSI|nr:Pyridoxine-5'-phosphate oxidase [Clonorchis sinensis]